MEKPSVEPGLLLWGLGFCSWPQVGPATVMSSPSAKEKPEPQLQEEYVWGHGLHLTEPPRPLLDHF